MTIQLMVLIPRLQTFMSIMKWPIFLTIMEKLRGRLISSITSTVDPLVMPTHGDGAQVLT